MKTIKVTGAIIQNDNNFLIGRRGEDEKSAGLWEFPGGKLEEDESLKECIKRELKEELDKQVAIKEEAAAVYKAREDSYINDIIAEVKQDKIDKAAKAAKIKSEMMKIKEARDKTRVSQAIYLIRTMA